MVAMVALVAAIAPAHTAVVSSPALFSLSPAALSPTLVAALPDGDRGLVSIVATDIDADGDLDLVANDASLQLFVWVNDGAGHFTRQRPMPAAAWRGEPADPAFDGGRPDAASSAQPDPPALHLPLRPSRRPLARARTPRVPLAPGVGTLARTVRTPRAPPSIAS